MKLDWSFPRQIFIALVVVGCLGTYPLMRYGTIEIIEASLIGALLTTVNVLLGYAAIEYSLGKSATTFFKFVIGGMGIRLLLMAGVLVLLIKAFRFNIAAMVGSMGIFYMIFLILEVLFIQKKMNTKQQS